MKHKLLTVLLAAVLALGACLGMAACGGDGEHEHTYTAENKCSVCGEEWAYTQTDAFEYTKVTLNGVEGYDVRFGEYEYPKDTYTFDPQTGRPVIEWETRGTLFEGEEIVFPYGYNGLPVISIGRTYPCTSETVKTITVPKSVFSWRPGIVNAGGPTTGSFRCPALEKLNLPDGIPVLTQSKISDIGGYPNAAYLLAWDTLFDGIGGMSGEVCPLYDDPQFRENGALYIGNYLFETKFEETVETFTVRDGTKVILDCRGAKNVIVPDSVETLATGAFGADYELKTVTLGKGVKVIGDSAFFYCKSLTSIAIPSAVSEIGMGAFANCTSLTDIQFAGTKEAWQAVKKGEDWDSETGDYTVTCTNGTIKKDGTAA